MFTKILITVCAVFVLLNTNAQLVASAGNDTTVCAGSPLVLNGSAHGGTAPYQFYWDSIAGLSCYYCTNPTVETNTGNVYGLTVIDATGDTAAAQVYVSINALPQVSITGPDSAVCRGQQVYLQGNANIFACGPALPCLTTTTSPQIGNGTTLQPGDFVTYPSIFGNYYQSCRQQMLYTADELLQVLGGAKTIDGLGFLVGQFASNAFLENFTIRIGCTPLDSLTDWDNALVTVLNPTDIQPLGGWNDFALSSAFYWDGTSNLVVELCFDNPGLFGNQLNKATCTITHNASYIFSAGNNDQCNAGSIPVVSNLRPNMVLAYCSPTAQSGAGLYSWQPSNGPDSVFSPENQNTYALPDSSTTYYLTITDGNGCISSDSIRINVGSDSIRATIAVTNATCSSGQPDGAISVNISSQYSVVNYAVVSSNYSVIYSGQSTGNDSLYFSSLSAGTHHLLLNDGHCSSYDYVFVIGNSDTIPVSVNLNVNAATCALNNGKLQAIFSIQGTDSFRINDSVGNLIIYGNAFDHDTITLDSLAPGPYYLILSGCFYLDTVFVVPISNLGTIGYNVISNDPTCPLVNNGSITATVNGNGVPVTFKLLNFNYTAILDSGVAADSGSVSFTSLVAGTYPLIISDSLCITLYDITLLAPSPINYIGNNFTPSCYADSTAGGCINISGGTPPFSYVWSDPNIIGACPNNMFTGNYSLTITDANNCSTVVSDIVVLQYPAINFEKVAASPGDSSYSVTLAITGGIPPYVIYWGDGSSAQFNDTASHTYTTVATYGVIIQDASGCTESSTVVTSFTNGILQNSSAFIKIFPNPASDQLFIESNPIAIDEIKILDVTGKQVLHYYCNGTQQSMIDISELSNGVYFLSAKYAGLEYRTPFVKTQ